MDDLLRGLNVSEWADIKVWVPAIIGGFCGAILTMVAEGALAAFKAFAKATFLSIRKWNDGIPRKVKEVVAQSWDDRISHAEANTNGSQRKLLIDPEYNIEQAREVFELVRGNRWRERITQKRMQRIFGTSITAVVWSDCTFSEVIDSYLREKDESYQKSLIFQSVIGGRYERISLFRLKWSFRSLHRLHPIWRPVSFWLKLTWKPIEAPTMANKFSTGKDEKWDGTNPQTINQAMRLSLIEDTRRIYKSARSSGGFSAYSGFFTDKDLNAP